MNSIKKEFLSFKILGNLAIFIQAIIYISIVNIPAKMPSDLPGQEITEQQYLNFILPKDSIQSKISLQSPASPTWLDNAMKTWDAPTLAKQIANDKKELLLGKGAVYIPSLGDPDLEPSVEIINEAGKVIATGRTGQKFNLIPDKYTIMVGNGSRKQRIKNTVTISEGKIKPLIPNWSGIQIDVINKNGMPFRGEYELVRIDTFQAFGRGYGSDPERGEKAKIWILKPGLYKIFGVGDNYNTITNFVTVRLLPAKYTRFILVNDNTENMKIIGGGIVNNNKTGIALSNWLYGINVGGSIDFSSYEDLNNNSSNSTTALMLLLNTNLDYKKNKIEWNSIFKVDEGITIPEFNILKMQNTNDEQRVSSMLTWRVIKWLGPYARAEATTELLPEYYRKTDSELSHYFILLNQDSSFNSIDSTSNSISKEPILYPLSIEIGAGANIKLLNTNIFKIGLRGGFGYKQEWHKDEAETNNEITAIKNIPNSINYNTITSNGNYTIIHRFEDITTSPELGPEISLDGIYRGRKLSVESKLKYFLPTKRLSKPDINWWATISLNLTRSVTLDYQYKYVLQRPEEESAQKQESKHRVLLRFSIVNR